MLRNFFVFDTTNWKSKWKRLKEPCMESQMARIKIVKNDHTYQLRDSFTGELSQSSLERDIEREAWTQKGLRESWSVKGNRQIW